MNQYADESAVQEQKRLPRIVVPIVSVVVAGLVGAGLATLAIYYGPMLQRWYRS